MKKKIINGLLIAVALVAATSSFVSCKDYNGDNYAELQEKYATLQDAFRAQVQAMQDYVLKTTFDQTVGDINGKIDEINKETGYSAAELANKGTIKARLDEIEKDLDPNNPNSLAEQVHKNNQAILSLGDTLRHFVFMWGDDLASAYANAGKAKQIALSYDTDTAKINQAIKDAQAIADKAWNYVNQGMAVDRDGKTKADLQAWVKYFEAADDALAEDIAALKQDVNNFFKLISQRITSIEIQETENPLFGTFSYPYGVQTNVLAAYFGEFDTPVKFPAGDQGSDKNAWVDPNAPAVLTSELKAINAPEIVYPKGIQMVEGPGNAGKIYFTVNPSEVIMDGKEFTLRTTSGKVSKVLISKPTPSDEDLMWGYKRAAGNGFYVATAEIKKEDAKDVAMSFNMNAFAKDVESMMQSSISASDIAKLVVDIRDGLKANVPKLGINAEWKDTIGWTNYYSHAGILAASIKPLGYDFLYNTDFSPSIVKFQNQLIAKEKAISQEFIKEIADAIKIQIGLPTTSGNVKVVGDKVYIVMPANSVTINGNATYTIGAGTLYTSVTPAISIPAADYPINAVVSATNPNEIELDITSVFNAIKNGIEQSIAGVDDKAAGIVNKVLNKVIDIENKVFGKVVSVAKNPNRYIQPALVARCAQLGYFYPSRVYLAPTEVKRGQKIMFYPTSLTAELVAPAFKKYVAVTGAWKTDNTDYGKIISMEDANKYNTGTMNTIFDGSVYNIDRPFEYTVDAPGGTVLEFTFECLGYNGKVAGKKYYIAVYE